jgi:hypothetical protein
VAADVISWSEESQMQLRVTKHELNPLAVRLDRHFAGKSLHDGAVSQHGVGG